MPIDNCIKNTNVGIVTQKFQMIWNDVAVYILFNVNI